MKFYSLESKESRQGATAISSGSLFHSGMVLGGKCLLTVLDPVQQESDRDRAGLASTFFCWLYVDQVIVGFVKCDKSHVFFLFPSLFFPPLLEVWQM